MMFSYKVLLFFIVLIQCTNTLTFETVVLKLGIA